MATITLTTAGAEDATIASDAGEILGLAGSASLAQIKAMIVADFKQKLKEHRQARAANVARAAATDPTVT